MIVVHFEVAEAIFDKNRHNRRDVAAGNRVNWLAAEAKLARGRRHDNHRIDSL